MPLQIYGVTGRRTPSFATDKINAQIDAGRLLADYNARKAREYQDKQSNLNVRNYRLQKGLAEEQMDLAKEQAKAQKRQQNLNNMLGLAGLGMSLYNNFIGGDTPVDTAAAATDGAEGLAGLGGLSGLVLGSGGAKSGSGFDFGEMFGGGDDGGIISNVGDALYDIGTGVVSGIGTAATKLWDALPDFDFF